MEKFYCKNDKNKCYKAKYNLVINIDITETEDAKCPECGSLLEQPGPTSSIKLFKAMKKSAKFVLPPISIALIVLLIYLLYEPSTQIVSIPTETTKQDQEYKYEVTLKNAKEDTQIAADKKPKWLKYNNKKNTLSGTPKNKDVGNHKVVIIAYIENKDTVTQEFSISVTNINDAPVIVSKTKNMKPANVDSSYTYHVKFADIDKDECRIAYINPQKQWLKVKNNTLYGTPTQSDRAAKNNKFTIFFTDGHDTAYQAIEIPIILGNQPPRYKGSKSKKAYEDKEFTWTIDPRKVFTDNDGDKISLTLDLPKFFKKRNQLKGKKQIYGTPTEQDVGLHKITIHYTDNITSSKETTIELEVLPTNDPPIFVSPGNEIALPKGDTLVYKIDCSDPEGDTIDITIIQKPYWLLYNNETQTFTGVVERADNRVIVLADDKNGGKTKMSFTIYAELPENEKNAMSWKPVLYSDYLKTKKTKAKSMSEIEQTMRDIKALDLKEDLKAQFKFSGSTAKYYIIDPNDIVKEKDRYMGEKCVLIKITTKGTSIIIKEAYSVPSFSHIYILE